jgi:hypothetical protein
VGFYTSYNDHITSSSTSFARREALTYAGVNVVFRQAQTSSHTEVVRVLLDINGKESGVKKSSK